MSVKGLDIIQCLSACGVKPQQKILAAVSGGGDSVALLHLLCQALPAGQVAAAHFHHGIRGKSADEDAALVEELCRKWNVQLILERGDVPTLAQQRHIGLEEAARLARYDFLFRAKARCGAQWIVTAHHGDDQAETVLLHLLRGAGSNGLSGIRPRRGDVVRPLLNVTKQELLDYLQDNQIPFREDETNASLDYTRNRIRHQLLPMLETYNPNIVQTICRTAQNLFQDEEYFLSLAQKALDNAKTAQGWSRSLLAQLPQPVQVRAMRLLLAHVGLFDVDRNIIFRLCSLLQARTGAMAELQNGIIARTSYDELILEKGIRQENTLCISFVPEQSVSLETGCFTSAYVVQRPAHHSLYEAYLDADTLPQDLCIRTRENGDRIYPLGAPGEKKLKDYWIDKKVPRQDRQIPMLCAREKVIFLPGYTICHPCRVQERTKRILRVVYTPWGKH